MVIIIKTAMLDWYNFFEVFSLINENTTHNPVRTIATIIASQAPRELLMASPAAEGAEKPNDNNADIVCLLCQAVIPNAV